jgi:hypothetical protein
MPWGETGERAGQSGIDQSGVVGEVGPLFGGRAVGAQQFAGGADGGGVGVTGHVVEQHRDVSRLPEHHVSPILLSR